jgi:hypothetical protein
MAEAAGESELGVAAGLTGTGEFRDTNLGRISREAAAARERTAGLEEQDISQATGEIAQSIKGLSDAIVRTIQTQMEQAVKEIETANFARNNQAQ